MQEGDLKIKALIEAWNCLIKFICFNFIVMSVTTTKKLIGFLLF